MRIYHTFITTFPTAGNNPESTVIDRLHRSTQTGKYDWMIKAKLKILLIVFS